MTLWGAQILPGEATGRAAVAWCHVLKPRERQAAMLGAFAGTVPPVRYYTCPARHVSFGRAQVLHSKLGRELQHHTRKDILAINGGKKVYPPTSSHSRTRIGLHLRTGHKQNLV